MRPRAISTVLTEPVAPTATTPLCRFPASGGWWKQRLNGHSRRHPADVSLSQQKSLLRNPAALLASRETALTVCGMDTKPATTASQKAQSAPQPSLIVTGPMRYFEDRSTNRSTTKK